MSVLDASALLSYLLDEAGAEAVQEALSGRAWIGAVNLAEVLTKLADAGQEPEEAMTGIMILGIDVSVFDENLAVATARLRPLTVRAGLSLGDRACLALGRLHRQPVLTADAAWLGLVPDLEIRVIR
ncbi:MAG: type II toxin-antitoxin system VapC family toxin [Actinomycetota bacterium]